MNASITRRGLVAVGLGLPLAIPAVVRARVAEPLRLRCSLDTVPSHSRNAGVRAFLKQFEAAAAGEVRVELFESGQLYPDLAVSKALLQGQVEMAVPGSWTLTGLIPNADFFQIPTLYGRTREEVHRVIDGSPGRLLAAEISQKLRVQVLGPWLDLGFFNWYTTRKPLRSLADLQGLKIRNAGGAGQAWRARFFGAIPNTTALPDVPLALSQGTFDGIATTNETIASGQFWESGIAYALEDHQFVGVYIPLVSLAFWNRLTPDLQAKMTALWTDGIGRWRADMAAAQDRARETMLTHRVSFAAPDADEIAATRKRMLAEPDGATAGVKVSPELLAAIKAAVGNAT
ncbi:TRAP transporter substrate-binding protein DctP [Methylobacterium sp. J-030]|uniref:TRAP transporter substrate-binding protein DctP n=1 Tax=Methylobacterium sp. J-030 TaxID=2836627 RepID=UPI001FBB26CD|nr:TRAP transporter substrate-binding protein DctP [Methylobacterium sp. J-030]MCJ2072427.1 TRAP transporter substrate-binding protein DctP [Methylobacterium sp. J-030]